MAKENELPELDDGEVATIVDIAVLKKSTKPPAPYTEGTLLDDMRAAAKFVEGDAELRKALKDASGLGTAATRHTTIEGIKNDKYVVNKGKNIVATEKGIALVQWLDTLLPELTDVAVTARWEAELAVIAQKGGGAAFEDKVIEKVRHMVATLKTAPALQGVTTSTTSEYSKMTDNTTQRTNKPTDKMLEFAKNVAKKMGQPLPDEVMASFDACRAYLDSNKEAANRPSEKQLNFANSIAERKGLVVPPEAAANSKELSKWIDDNK